jgi:hypothetical protein
MPPDTIPPLRLFGMLNIQLMWVVVHLHNKGALMVCSRRETRSHRTSTSWIWTLNSVFKALHITNSDIILEVRRGSCHSVLVWLLFFSSPPSILSLCCYPPLLIVTSTPAIPMPHERGKLKRGLTYYRFVARQLRSSPSSTPILPPLSAPSPIGPSLNNLPHIGQNWMEEDRATILVEEYFPLLPPQSPLNSLFLYPTDLRCSPRFNYGKSPS